MQLARSDVLSLRRLVVIGSPPSQTALRWKRRTLAGIYLGTVMLGMPGSTLSVCAGARGTLARCSAPTRSG